VASAASKSKDVDVAVVPPFPFLPSVKAALAGSSVMMGAQDLYTEDKGAFTGAVATSMIKSVGAEWVLVGHSERRA
jgi:triosephosphate isomerase